MICFPTVYTGSYRGTTHTLQPNSTWTFGQTTDGDGGDHHIAAANDHAYIAPGHARIERMGDRQSVRISEPPPRIPNRSYMSFIYRGGKKPGIALNMALDMNIGDYIQFGPIDENEYVFELAAIEAAEEDIAGAVAPSSQQEGQQPQPQPHQTHTSSSQSDPPALNLNTSGTSELIFTRTQPNGECQKI